MKYLFFTLFISFFCFSQTAKYNQITSKNNFDSYISSTGKTLKIGDTIKIGLPRTNYFQFITQGNQPCGVQIANTKNIISAIKSIGDNKRGFKIFILFKGWGLIPVYIDYETALLANEIIE